MMVEVLLGLSGSGILDEYPNLSAYVARGEARPAFKRDFDAQLAVFIAASNRLIKATLGHLSPPARMSRGRQLTRLRTCGKSSGCSSLEDRLYPDAVSSPAACGRRRSSPDY